MEKTRYDLLLLQQRTEIFNLCTGVYCRTEKYKKEAEYLKNEWNTWGKELLKKIEDGEYYD